MSSRTRRRRRHLLNSPSEIDRCCRAKQHGGNLVLRRALGPLMAADADTLFSTTDPEPSAFLAKNCAVRIQQRKSNRSIRRNSYKERTVLLNGCRAKRHCFALRVLCVEPN